MSKILVIAPSWVGDTMLMHPLLARLKQRHPDSFIDVLAPAWTEELLRQMPEVSNTITNPFPHGSLQLAARFSLGMQLRNRYYDQAIVLPNSLKSALVPFFAGIPIRTGYVGEMRYGLLNDARKLDKHALPLMVERFAQLAELPRDAISRPLPQPRLLVSQEQSQPVLDKFGLTLEKPVAVFCPGAEYGPAKRWPIPYFAELAQHLQQQGYAVWIVGSRKEQEIGDKIVALGNLSTRNLCGSTSLGDAISLLSCASLVVSNDSGLMHIAAALDRPMLALYGSSSPGFTPPLSQQAQILKIDIACSPCFKRECPLGHFKCMKNLTPQMVAEHIPASPSL
ncbi:MAG: lipopolysaccharide heptosyltransferase II [Gallionellales bacterium 35-53-114]|nr:MAG: lipopolysaccharide heptosyltransferase II [Gallionellales bacterium 35-53-114]OYZ62934.1 MAG: lipopolysaccharide heptosyltransferase II [Gallionellales bacterium 24-53-125]OZB10007.1 MAG: lipopolysaccharide heptosyltransferase II [Gallionellales bacterium 39-52-133]HQS58412.1 lipopolysaccharide heptosyltransferase II [Gallionellaceae bacterium]HQS73967.1 lipopolysaccharide heptosyltransferase II [Gallionellaceae bacterium]